jgi:uncharacterized protein DUF1761
MDDFSWIALIVGALAFYFLGAIWYTFLFRRPWMADMDIDPNTPVQSPGPKLLIGSFVVALVLAGVTEKLVGNGDTGHGLCVGIGIGAALAAVMGQNALYDTRPARLWVINAGYAFVGAVIVGVIAGAISP